MLGTHAHEIGLKTYCELIRTCVPKWSQMHPCVFQECQRLKLELLYSFLLMHLILCVIYMVWSYCWKLFRIWGLNAAPSRVRTMAGHLWLLFVDVINTRIGVNWTGVPLFFDFACAFPCHFSIRVEDYARKVLLTKLCSTSPPSVCCNENCGPLLVVLLLMMIIVYSRATNRLFCCGFWLWSWFWFYCCIHETCYCIAPLIALAITPQAIRHQSAINPPLVDINEPLLLLVVALLVHAGTILLLMKHCSTMD